MNCSDEKLSWYLDGEAPEVAEHLKGCAACGAKLEEMKRANELLREAARGSLPPAEPRLKFRRPVGVRWRVLWGAAAAMLAGLTTWFFVEVNRGIEWQAVTVVGSGTWIEGSEGRLRVLVHEGRQGRPLAGARVRAELDSGVWTEVVSGEDGSAEVRLPAPKAGHSHLTLTVLGRDGRQDSLHQGIRVERPLRLLITTDKPIYQPEQTVHIRVLAVNDLTMKPYAGEIDMEIEDSNGNRVARKRLTSGEFGLASMDFDLADETPLGSWKIKTRAEGVESERAIEVRRYVLPKFRVDLSADRPYYEPGQVVRLAIDAAYIFGKPVGGAAVRVEAFTWLVNEFRSGARAAATTDSNGHAAVELKLPERMFGTELDRGDATVKLEAFVVDGAGHEETKAVLVPVTRAALRVAVVPEGGDYVPGVAQNILVAASWADGRPAEVDVETGDRRPLGRTDATGILVAPIPAESFRLLARASDGATAVAEIRMTDYAGRQNFLMRTDRARYRTGETVRVDVLSAVDGSAYVDVLRNGMTLLTKSLQIREGRGEVALDLPQDVPGSLRVVAWRLQPGGTVERDARVVLVEPSDGLQIRPSLSKPVYEPGEEIRASFDVTDSNGKPAVAALSLSVVDEAVFALAQSRPGMERTWLAIQEDLLKPRYQLKGPESSLPFRLAIADKGASPRLCGLAAGASYAAAHRQKQERVEWAQLFVGWFTGLVVAAWLIRLFHRSLHAVLFGAAAGLVVAMALTPDSEYQGAMAVLLGITTLTAVVLSLASSEAFRTYQNPSCLGWTLLGAGALVIAVLLLPALSSARKSRFSPESAAALKSMDTASTGPRTGADPVSHRSDSPRIREFFPETLYWNPQVLTDENGRATVTFPGADSITTWRMATSGISRGGLLGATDSPIRVFQPFFVDLDLPLDLTQGDEIWLPVAVYNYLDHPQTVRVAFEAESGFDLVGAREQTLDVRPGDVTSVSFHLRARDFGRHRLLVTATGTSFSDALRRHIDVHPDGALVPFTQSGTLARSSRSTLSIPAHALDGTPRAWVRLFPSRFSETVSGLEGLVQLPYG